MEQTSGAGGAARMALTATYAMPGYLLVIYALLILTLGWFAHQRWGEKPPALAAAHAALPATSVAAPAPHIVPDASVPLSLSTAPTPVAAPTVAALTAGEAATSPVVVAPAAMPPAPVVPQPPRAIDGQLPALAYSAHVFTTEPAQRSITLNGVRYKEGESPMEGVVIEQIQQDVTLFNVNGDVFILDALADWPGGDIRDAN